MELLLIRHGVAEDRTTFEGSDDDRPLAQEGVEKMKKNARGLKRLVEKPDAICSSPLLRARQTAQVLLSIWPQLLNSERWMHDFYGLTPDSSPEETQKEILTWIGETKLSSVTSLVLVGHEPNLSYLASYYLTGGRSGFVNFKKGGACLLEFQHKPKANAARLNWLLTPKQLRSLAR